MIQTINKLVTIIISIFYLFTIKMEYFVNENLHISSEQLPTLMPKCALIEVKTDDYAEIFVFYSLFFSISFFFSVFLLTFISSNCIARYTIYFLVLFEFFLTRYICFFFIQLDTQLILIRFLRFLSVSFSIFLLFFCFKCTARRRLYQQKPKTTKRRKTPHKEFHSFADLLTGIWFFYFLCKLKNLTLLPLF